MPQGSEEEKGDLKEAYIAHKGSLPLILDHIPHASHADEDRLVGIVNDLIASGELESTKKWTTTSNDKTAKAKRGKAAAKEAKQAEAAAKELGVWDEFYGSGKKGKRQGDKQADEGEAGLQALILKRQQERSGALDRLAAKYEALEEQEKARKVGKGKKRKSDVPVSRAKDRCLRLRCSFSGAGRNDRCGI
jgi:DnaJ family protein C protein 9